ncbi:hypothetical protein C5167_006823 [Papaver somniferum]|uniref:Uncharacterized protein n=1 Tax=Papaver somniferum TaxID=3469 RepID=A0A4Y7JIN2_PAPSO|nr:hypothetical protein C5167_006823 [Papaver somniferum]
MSEKVVPPSTTEKWLYGHLKRDGTVHPSALEVHGKVSGDLEEQHYVHCRKVKPTEKRVYVEEVHDQSALVWGGPQGDYVKFLKDLELPTFLIWSEDRLRFVSVKLVGGNEGELPIHGTFQFQFYLIQVYNQDIMISHKSDFGICYWSFKPGVKVKPLKQPQAHQKVYDEVPL